MVSLTDNIKVTVTTTVTTMAMKNANRKYKMKFNNLMKLATEMASKSDMKLDMTRSEEEIYGSTITFYIPSVIRADASTITMESTEIKITTLHAETMTETVTTYDMMMTTEIEPKQLSPPSTTSYSKLDIESATHILTLSTPNTVLEATNNILPSMPNYVNYCKLSTMPSAQLSTMPSALPTLRYSR